MYKNNSKCPPHAKYLNAVTSENNPKETTTERYTRILKNPSHETRYAGKVVRKDITYRPVIPPLKNTFG